MGLADVLSLRAGFPSGPHSMTGPIEVRGARVGDVLRADVVALRPGPWGFNLALPAPLGRGVLADRFPEGALTHFALDRDAMTTRMPSGVELPLEPFLGIMGVAPPDDGPHSSVPPGPYGGNLDLRDVLVGSALFLPVFRDGAGFYAGDGHALQGDGEVDQTAIETSMERAHLRLSLLRADAVAGLPRLPWLETAGHLVCMGLDEDLDVAVRAAVDALVSHLVGRFRLAGAEAYTLCSLMADVEVTQVVNRVKGAHIRLPWSAIGRAGPPG
jgi:acetamidase/formamidase